MYKLFRAVRVSLGIKLIIRSRLPWFGLTTGCRCAVIRLMGLTAISEDYSKSVAWAITGQGILIEQRGWPSRSTLLSGAFKFILFDPYKSLEAYYFHPRKGRAYFVEWILVSLFKQSKTRTKAFLILMWWQSTGSGANSECESQICHLQAVWSSLSHISSIWLSFLTCKMGGGRAFS